MTAAATLLGDLRQRGVELWAEGDRLRLSAPKGVLTPDLRSALRAHKSGILAALRGGVAVAPAAVEAGEPPLSFTQERIWFVDRLDPGSPAYNIPMVLDVRGALCPPALDAAFDALVVRHEILRTICALDDSRPVQRVAPPVHRGLPVVDLGALDHAARAEARGLVTRELRRGFELTRGPLLRSILLTIGAGRWQFLVITHHFLADGWSMQILLRELSLLYGAGVAGRPSPLPPLSMQFGDFARWQRRWLRGSVLERQLAYWTGQLGPRPPVLDLPTDRPRPAVQSFRGARRPLSLGGTLSDGIRSFARTTRSTLFMALLAVFQTLLQRYCHARRVLVGTAISNRNRPELEGLIGPLSNNLALLTDFAGDPGFRQLVDQVRRVAVAAYAHQDLPFEHLVRALGLDRDTSRNPLFQILFVVGNAPPAAAELGDLPVTFPELEGAPTSFDLVLAMADGGGEIGGALEFNADLFDAVTAGRMAVHFRTLLAGALARPDAPLSTLPLLSAEERWQMLSEWNATRAPFPDAALIHELVEAQAAKSPDAVAVVCGDAGLSYRELNRRANQLARHLSSLGVGPETRVGICVDRSLEMVVGLLGTLKSGGAYLPLDPSYPPQRLAFMLDDAGVAWLLTQAHLLATLPEHQAPRLLLDDGWPAIAVHDASDLPCRSSAENLAYVIYTSGSTGQPKGSMLNHRGVVNQLCWRQARYHLDGDDRVLQAASFCFDVSVWDFFAPLIAGARLVEPRTDGPPTSGEVLRLLVEERVTVMQLGPSRLQALVDEPGLETFSGLRCLITGGEVLAPELKNRLLFGFTTGLHNLYGPTEASIDVTHWTCRRDAVASPVPIGRLIANQRLYLLDFHLRPVPLGIPGELCVVGVGLARGYLRRPALTARRFVADPLSRRPGERLYRTGDLARYRGDGNLEFLGRLDDQVKVRGLRIELGEIEAALTYHPAVREAVVVVREDEPGDQRIVAYVVADREECEVSGGELRASLRDRLPPFMVPSAFLTLEALPLTPNGKIDRRRLPAPAWGSATYIAPRSSTEELVAGIWADVLGVARVGAEDDFFELGGHSLLATRVLSRLEESFGVEVPLRQLFEQPTPAALAAGLEAGRQVSSAGEIPPLVSVPRSTELPLSFAQQRLWFLAQLGAGGAAYKIPTALRLKGVLDVDALRSSLRVLAERHEVLRTWFPAPTGKPYQQIAPPGEVALTMVDLSALTDGRRSAELHQRMAEDLERPMDLERGPLLSCLLMRLTRLEHVLSIVLHHTVADGGSLGLLLRELEVLYGAFRRGQNAELSALVVQYADYSVWQRRWLRGDLLARQTAYWREQLRELPSLELTTDRPRPSRQSFRGRRRLLAFPPRLSGALTAWTRKRGATLFMTLTAAFMVLLARLSGQRDLAVGTPAANRPRRELELLIGLFVNTLVLRGDLKGNSRFGQHLKRVRETCLDAYAHQDLPFERLVQELGVERDLSRPPLFQVMFILHDMPLAGPALDGLEVAVEPLETGNVTSDLILSLVPGDDGLSGSLEYNADLFDDTTAERMTRHFTTLIEAVVDHQGEQRLVELPLLGAAESHQLRAEWNDTHARFDLPVGELTLHRLFEEQVARTPGGTAVIRGGERLTYDQLDRRANRLAHRLRRLGVGPEVVVALAIERCVEMLVALLGILKAGGVYLPLEPTLPVARLALILRDSKARLVLTRDRLAEELAGFGEPSRPISVVVLTEDEPAGSEARPRVELDQDNLAYVIYTSGSTGQPKGVMVAHRGISNTLLWRRAAFSLSSADRVLQNIPFTFDPSLWQIFGALISGATLVLPEQGAHQDFPRLVELIQEHAVTITDFAPSMLKELLADPGFASCRSIERIFAGGEALPYELQEELLHRLPARLHNIYGPTEAAIDATCGTCRPGLAPTIGRPIANKEIYLLGRDVEPVPLGAVGELLIGGAGLTRGYLDRAGATAERLVPHPWSAAPGARLYRTGDLVRYRADGELEFLGRTDHQVKIRGQRVELEEVEHHLGRVPGVRECAVVTRGSGAHRRLEAWLSLDPGITTEEVRRALREDLPEHMVPAAFAVLEALPRTVGGKVDRAALSRRELPEEAAVPAAALVTPSTDLERVLVEIWQEALGLPQVGVDDNFFDLGGHSLLLAQVQRRVSEALGRKLPMVDLFAHPNVRSLARHLSLESADQLPRERIRGQAARQVAALERQRKAQQRARRRR